MCLTWLAWSVVGFGSRFGAGGVVFMAGRGVAGVKEFPVGVVYGGEKAIGA